jgi:hypothetical protein
LIGRFIGERYGEDVFRPNVKVFDQMRHTVRNDSGFTATGARKNQNGSLCRFNRFQLFRIEKLRKIHLVRVEPTAGT